MFPLGQPITLSTVVTNSVTGLPADAGTISLKLYRGSILVQTYAPTHDGAVGSGRYHQDIPTTDLSVTGRYRYEWVATGANAGDDSDVFDVFDPAAYPRLVSFADASSYVRLLGTQDNALLDRMIGWASARVLRECQAYRQTRIETVSARDGCRLQLSYTPVVSITSAVAGYPGMTSPAVSDLYVAHPLGGVVKSTSWLDGPYTVTYVAGYDEVPPGVDGACLDLIQHWWTQSQSHGSATYGDTGFVPDFSGLPNAVKNKLAGVRTVWGYA